MEKISYTNLTDEQKQEIIDLHLNGESALKISSHINVGYKAICRILKEANVFKGWNTPSSWKPEEDECLVKLYPTYEWGVLLKAFPGRTKQELCSRASALGLTREKTEFSLFTEKEDNILKEYYITYGPKYIKENFMPYRTESSIKARANRLGLSMVKFWTQEEKDIIMKYYSIIPLDQVMEKLPGRSRDSIINQARLMRIKSFVTLQKFSEEESNYIKENYLTMTDEEIGNILSRSTRSVRDKRLSLGLIRPTHPLFDSVCEFCRHNNYNWKVRSMRNCDYKCIITGERFNDIHHLYGLNLIVREVCDELNISYEYDINNASDEMKAKILNKFYEVQDRYPLGVCLRKDIHQDFHNCYGYGYNTPEQFEEFLNTLKN